MAKKKGTKKEKASKREPATSRPQPERTPAGEPTPSPPPETTGQGSPERAFDINALVDAMLKSLVPEPPSGADKRRDKLIQEFIKHQIAASSVSNSYNILILHDESRMVKSDADHIYSAANAFTDDRPLLLVLYSSGGLIDSAYLIGKLCREYSTEKFVVAVPRQAKSGATLICCAADEIHMGSLSELGPIDPQIKDLPALGLKASVEHIADLIKSHPHASDMFAKYLNMSLQPIHLGYYERVAESAAQYAERLLSLHAQGLAQEPAQIAKALVYSYKDHGFVIDKAEASLIFGDQVVKTDTELYGLGNNIYSALMFVSRVARAMNHHFYFIGSPNSEPHFQQNN